MLAAQEVVSGVIGFATVLVGLIQEGFAARVLPGAAVSLLFFSLSLFAGAALWANRSPGFTASVAVQFVQVPRIAGPQFAFLLGLAPDVMVLWFATDAPVIGQVSGLTVNASPLPVAHVGTDPLPGARAVLGVSLLPFLWLTLLRKVTDVTPAVTARVTPAKPTLAPAGNPSAPDWSMPVWMKIAAFFAVAFITIRCGACMLTRLPE